MGVPSRGIAEWQHVEGMEADGGIEIVVVAGCRMDGLGAAQLLRRFAEELQGATNVASLHGILGGEKPPEAGNTQRGMGVGMTASEFTEAFPGSLDRIRRLAISRYRIILGVSADDWSIAVAEGGAKRRGHAAAARLHFESLLAQPIHIPGGRTIFPPCGFAEIEDDLVPVGQNAGVFLDPMERVLAGVGIE